MTQVFDDVGEIVETTLRRLGNRIVLATPLGIGKPNAVINEFYRRAARNPEISLTIVTALSLAKPRAKSELEGRLVGPLAERFYPDYIELDYISAQREGRVPSNIKIHEFYLRAGAYLGIASAQQTYLSSNYTHVARDIISLGLNVIVQSVASRSLGRETQYSLSSNPDLTLDLLPHLLAERAAGRPSTFIGSLNKSLPFMLGDAVISEETFDFLLDHPRYQQAPFAVPSAPINTQDYCLGLYATSLVKDGGTLQLGIGELADSIVYALQLRQQRNDQFQLAYRALAPSVAAEKACLENGGIDSLNRGLYGCSEMFVDGFLDLFQTGVLKRPVYENIELQKLLDSGAITERIDKDWLDRLVAAGLETIDGKTFAALEAGGAFNPGTRYQARTILSASGERLSTDLTDPKAREALLAKAFSKRLNGGTLLHAAFFLGPRGFYSALRELPEVDRQRINMTAVSFVNQIRGADSELRTAQRRHGRFFNTAMLVTLLGAVTSDGLESGQVVSGVGGQYNFVSMAHDLPDARSVILLRSTHTRRGLTRSNIVWSYGHTTIPRHLRDIVVTEYGIAQLRGRSDRDCIVAMLEIADSRFQAGLLQEAKKAGKIEASYEIPGYAQNNYPQRLEEALKPFRHEGLFSSFPFGTDFTQEEIVLMSALRRLDADTRTPLRKFGAIIATSLSRPLCNSSRPYLERLELNAPAGLTQTITAKLVRRAILQELEDRRVNLSA